MNYLNAARAFVLPVLTLGQKIALLVALFTSLLIGLSAYSFLASRAQKEASISIESAWSFALDARNLAQAVEHVAVVAGTVFSANDRDEVKALLSTLKQSLADLQKAKSGFFDRADTRLEAADRTRIDLALKEFVAYQNDTIELGLTISPKAALIQANDEATIKNRGKIIATMQRLSERALQDLSKIRDQASIERAAQEQLLIVVPLLITLVGILIAFWIVYFGIRRPISVLIGSMRRVAEGDYASPVPFSKRRDEIGTIASAVESFKQDAIKRVHLEKQADEQREESEVLSRASAQEKEAQAASARQTIDMLGCGLDRLSRGDLSQTIDTPFPPEFEQLRLDFNQAMQKLGTILRSVVQSAQTMDDRISTIAQSGQDLLERTSQQAARLEETAMTLDGITSSGKKAADGAAHARQVVSVAQRDASTIGEVVHKTIDAMAGIEKSSQQIGQIIGVIDEIAFQTNLLALNAGVEAARAGDSGRGFAVVAQEVRALAQRSADAAKQIKTLISSSSKEVAAGVGLVAETGQAIDRVLIQIADISTVVLGIAASAQDQAAGLQQVNAAISQMDMATRANTAMVSETTRAGHALAEDSSSLTGLVAELRLMSDHQTPQQIAAPKIHSHREPTRPRFAARASASAAPRRAASGGSLQPKVRAAAETDWRDF